MPGRGPAPKLERRNKADKPIRGEWRAAPGIGWQHGAIPPLPHGNKMSFAARTAWDVWFRSWFAAHWTPDDLPGLGMVIRLYNAVDRGDFTRAGELRQMMDNYGITPKGQQDRRWTPPERPTALPDPVDLERKPRPYDHLREARPGS